MTNSPDTTNPSGRKARHELPDNKLPENERSRALWIGYEASKWFPFDPLVYLERSALAGAAVMLQGGGVYYQEPNPGCAEYEFLRGWHNGCPGATKMVAKALEDNPAAHWRLWQLPPVSVEDN
jgi:hypothetical protein